MKRAVLSILALILGAALAAPTLADQQAGEVTQERAYTSPIWYTPK